MTKQNFNSIYDCAMPTVCSQKFIVDLDIKKEVTITPYKG